MVLELLSGAKTNAQVCREHQLAASVVSAWKDQFAHRAPEIFASPTSQSLEQERIAELERVAGRLARQPGHASPAFPSFTVPKPRGQRADDRRAGHASLASGIANAHLDAFIHTGLQWPTLAEAATVSKAGKVFP